MLMYIEYKHMDIEISAGFGFGVTYMLMDTFLGGAQ
jgi:hypothetical protein